MSHQKNGGTATSVGTTRDTMDPAHIGWMSRELPRGSYLFCPVGSHLCMWDGQTTYMAGLIRFMRTSRPGRNRPETPIS